MSWFETFSGEKVDPATMRPDQVRKEDLAHALSQMCRFNGHTRTFYSVAEHSMRVATLVSPGNRLWALLHDASEAYLSDVVRPVKHTSAFDAYRELEARVQCVVAKAFKLWPDEPLEVKRADRLMLIAERRDLMPNCEWRDDTYTREVQTALRADAELRVPKIVPFPMECVEQCFLMAVSLLS